MPWAMMCRSWLVSIVAGRPILLAGDEHPKRVVGRPRGDDELRPHAHIYGNSHRLLPVATVRANSRAPQLRGAEGTKSCHRRSEQRQGARESDYIGCHGSASNGRRQGRRDPSEKSRQRGNTEAGSARQVTGTVSDFDCAAESSVLFL